MTSMVKKVEADKAQIVAGDARTVFKRLKVWSICGLRKQGEVGASVCSAAMVHG